MARGVFARSEAGASTETNSLASPGGCTDPALCRGLAAGSSAAGGSGPAALAGSFQLRRGALSGSA